MNFYMNKRIISVCLFFFVIFLYFEFFAVARGGVTFSGERLVNIKKPVIFTIVENGKSFFYSAAKSNLIIFDANFNEISRINLKAKLQPHFSAISHLIYNRVLNQVIMLDPDKKYIHFMDVNGNIQQSVSLNVSHPVTIKKADSIAVDANGRIYIGDIDAGDVKVFSLDGLYLFSIKMPAHGTGKFSKMHPVSLAVMSSGNLVVFEDRNNSVSIFSRSGTLVSTKKLKGDFKKISGLTILQDNSFIGFDQKFQKILKWDAKGEVVSGFGSKGDGRGKFQEISDISFNASGEIFVLDKKRKNIQTFSFQEKVQPFNDKTPDISFKIKYDSEEFFSQNLVTLLDDGAVFFNSQKKTVIIKRNSGTKEIAYKKFNRITAAYLGKKYYYFFDDKKHLVFVFDSVSNDFAFKFGGSGKSGGSLGNITKIISDGKGMIFLVDISLTKIHVFSADCIYIDSFGKQGDKKDSSNIGKLQDIILYNSDLAILDSKHNKIKIFKKDGQYIRNISPDFPFSSVRLTSITADSNGFLALNDQKNSQIYVIDDAGKMHFRFGCKGKRKTDWNKVESIHVNSKKKLRISDFGEKSRIVTLSVRSSGISKRIKSAITQKNWADAKALKNAFFENNDTNRNENKEYAAILRLAMQIAIDSDGDYAAAIKLAKDNPDVFSTPDDRENLGLWLQQTNQVKNAMAVLKKLLSEHPERLTTRLELIRIYMDADDIITAIQLAMAGTKIKKDKHLDKIYQNCIALLKERGLDNSNVQISECKIAPVFSAIYQNYYDFPGIDLVLINQGSKQSRQGSVLFFAQAIMTNPTETPLPSIEPFSTITIKLKSTFNRNILTYTEATRISATVELRFNQRDDAGNIKKNVSFQLMGRNSMDWKKELMIACFITPKDPAVQTFARKALKIASEELFKSTIDENLYNALILYDAMQSIGVYYLPDPTQPFSFFKFASKGALDYILYPRETLHRQSGDCDDLSVLYASLLEGAGIQAIMVTSPGHLFPAFALKNGKQTEEALGLPPELLIKHEGQYYVPVETTLIGNSFVSAWRAAANIVEKYSQENKIGIINIRKAWKNYQTVSLPPDKKEPPLPSKKILAKMLSRELNALNLKQVENKLNIYKKLLEYEPSNIELMLFLAEYYGKAGLFDSAQEHADKALTISPQRADVHMVLGNLAYLKHDFPGSIKAYEKSNQIENSASAHLNIALYLLKDGKLIPARKAFHIALEMNDKIAENYPELKQLLE